MTPLTFTDYFHIGLPILTMLIGIWVGHSGFTGAFTQVKTDISDIKNMLHGQAKTPVVAPVATTTHA